MTVNKVNGKVSNESGIFPFSLNVLLEMPKVEEKTKGGIYLPDNLKGTQQLLQTVGLILDHGQDAFTNAFGNKYCNASRTVGCYAIINLHSGREIKLDDNTYRIVSSDEIIATITPKAYEEIKNKL